MEVTDKIIREAVYAADIADRLHCRADGWVGEPLHPGCFSPQRDDVDR